MSGKQNAHAIAPSPYATHRYLEEDNLAVLPEGCLDFAFRRALGNVGDVQRRRRLEDVGGVLGAGLLEPMERRTCC